MGVKFEHVYSDQVIQSRIKPTLRQEFLDFFYYFLRVFLVVSIIFTFVRTFIFVTIGIEGQSMYPTLIDNQVVYLDLLTPHVSDYRRGDIVVVKPPQDIYERDGRLYIKRIIGLPEETVGFQDGSVFIYNSRYPDGIELEETYLEESAITYKKIQVAGEGFIEDRLEGNEYYVLGDNRTQSVDSRVFQEVDKDRILGRVFYTRGGQNGSSIFELPRYNINN